MRGIVLGMVLAGAAMPTLVMAEAAGAQEAGEQRPDRPRRPMEQDRQPAPGGERRAEQPRPAQPEARAPAPAQAQAQVQAAPAPRAAPVEGDRSWSRGNRVGWQGSRERGDQAAPQFQPPSQPGFRDRRPGDPGGVDPRRDDRVAGRPQAPDRQGYRGPDRPPAPPPSVGYRSDPRSNQWSVGQGYGRGDYRAAPPPARGNWNRGWRGDRRYDWGGYRTENRQAFHLPRYYAPRGWGFGYRRFAPGLTLSALLFDQSYWIDDPFDYRLPPAYGPYRWVRYYNDALLVDIRTGYVVDTVYDIFW